MSRPELRVWFRLAASRGISVRRCQEIIDSDEFTWWQAYYEVEPDGPAVADVRFGQLMSLLFNHLVRPDFPVGPSEFRMGKFRTEIPAADPDEIHRALHRAR